MMERLFLFLGLVDFGFGIGMVGANMEVGFAIILAGAGVIAMWLPGLTRGAIPVTKQVEGPQREP